MEDNSYTLIDLSELYSLRLISTIHVLSSWLSIRRVYEWWLVAACTRKNHGKISDKNLKMSFFVKLGIFFSHFDKKYSFWGIIQIFPRNFPPIFHSVYTCGNDRASTHTHTHTLLTHHS